MINRIKNKISVKKVFHELKKLLLVIIGTMIVAVSASIFLVPFQIVSGGISGLGIILDEISGIPADIWIYIFTWSLFILGLIFLGIRFSLTTLVSTIIYPIIVSVILRTGLGLELVNSLIEGIGNGVEAVSNNGVLEIVNLGNIEIGRILIIGLIGGALTGIGCGITFIGGGSTGGVDIAVFIIHKFTGIKTSVCTFIIDGAIVLVALIFNAVNKNFAQLYACLIGIFSAIMASVLVDLVYVRQKGAYVADVITDKAEEIRDAVTKELDRSVTIYNVVGGYSEEEKICVRIVFSKNELLKVKDLIAEIDKEAFYLIAECGTVNGEGFAPIKSSKENTITKIKNEIDKNKDGKQ